MPDENVITPAPEPEFSLQSYRTEREAPPTESAPEPSAEAEKPSETAPDSETGDQEQEHEPEEQKAKGKGGFQRRIDKLVARQAELERQLAEKSAALPQPEAKPTDIVPASLTEPKLEDFASYDAFLAAHAAYTKQSLESVIEEKFRAREEAARQAREQAELQARQAQFTEKLNAARAAHEDFDELVGAAPQITQTTRDFILSSEVGADVMYQLASYPEAAARIATMTPMEQVKILTVLEGYLNNAKAAPEPAKLPAPHAPEPIQPLGTSAAPMTNYKPEMDYESYKRWRQSGGGR